MMFLHSRENRDLPYQAGSGRSVHKTDDPDKVSHQKIRQGAGTSGCNNMRSIPAIQQAAFSPDQWHPKKHLK